MEGTDVVIITFVLLDVFVFVFVAVAVVFVLRIVVLPNSH